MDRRAFFRRMASRSAPLRPPFAKPEPDFTQVCDGCGACLDACPASIIRADRLARPLIDFSRGGCTFCDACAAACDRGAFEPARAQRPPWDVTVRAGDACLEAHGIVCRACEGACEAAAIGFRPLGAGRARITISQAACTGCGACIAACPVAALSPARAAPARPTIMESVS